MRNYLVLTPVRGLPRVDRSREPVGANAVIALPDDKAMELSIIGAVEPSDVEATVALDWPTAMVTTVFSSPSSPPIAVVAATDRYALVSAIEELGGIVFFVGEGLPDRAEEALPDFSNEQLLDELKARIEEGRLTPEHLNAIDDSDGAPGQPEPVAAAVEEHSPTEMQATDVIEPPVPAVPPADAKPMRKKAAAK